MAMNSSRTAFALALWVSLAGGGHSQDLGEVNLEIASRRLYHGYERGDGWSLAPGLDLGLAGSALSSTGRWGLFLEVRGGILLEDREAHRGADDATLRLLSERKLGEGGDNRLTLGYAQSLFSRLADTPSHSEEVFGRFQAPVSKEGVGFNLRPFAEIAYDFTRYRGVYVALGFDHEMSLETRLGPKSSFQVDGRVAFSDQRSGDLQTSRALGFHHASLGLALPFEKPIGSLSTLVFGPSVGWDWASHAIRRRGHFSWGAKVRLVR